MGHITPEDLVEFHEDRMSPDARRAAESHLAACASCHELRQDLASLLAHLREDGAFEPPAHLVQWGVDLFQPLLRPAETGGSVAGRVRRIIAKAILDTYNEPILAGVRRATAAPRQLLFRAGDIDVDVKIESLETDGRISLAGQVLSSAPTFLDNTSVKLESHGVVRLRKTTNLVGEF